MKVINTTLCYIEKDGKYLMLLRNKKKNDINEGKWIGIGGKFEAGETAEVCLLREVREETGLTLTSYKYRGIVHFVSDKCNPEDMYLYTADGFIGELKECDEGELKWVDKSELFGLNLWEGDIIFLKKLINDESDIDLLLKYEGDKCVDISDSSK